MISLEGKSIFFEKRVSEYRMPRIKPIKNDIATASHTEYKYL